MRRIRWFGFVGLLLVGLACGRIGPPVRSAPTPLRRPPAQAQPAEPGEADEVEAPVYQLDTGAPEDEEEEELP